MDVPKRKIRKENEDGENIFFDPNNHKNDTVFYVDLEILVLYSNKNYNFSIRN